MPRAEVFIEDAEPGAPAGASVRFVFLEGFDAASPAHQLANILRAKLDEMTKAGELTALNERETQGDMLVADEELAKIST